MLAPDPSQRRTAEIRQRMQAIRCGLTSGVEEAREDFSNLADWKYYVRTYPAIVLPTVVLAAYSLVPQFRASRMGQIAVMDTDQGVRRVKLVEEPQAKKSFIAAVVGSLVTVALRQSSTLAVNQLMHVLNGAKNSA